MEGKKGMGAQRSDVPCLKSHNKSIAQVGIKGGQLICRPASRGTETPM